ncbi:MAG: PAS domain-containing protein [Caulobacteraceae bacterium]
MAHPNTELLIEYWRSLRRSARVPDRAGVDPAGFARLAPWAFMAGRGEDGAFAWRLAGEAVIALHGRPLAGTSFLALWRAPCRARLAATLSGALVAGEPAVVAAQAPVGRAERLELEVLFAPLSGPGGSADRFLGLYQPLRGHLAAPLGELALAERGAASRALRLATLDGRRIAMSQG